MDNSTLLDIIRQSAIAYMQDSFYFAELGNDRESKDCATLADFAFAILETIEYSLNNGYKIYYSIDDIIVRDLVHFTVMVKHRLYDRLGIAV